MNHCLSVIGRNVLEKTFHDQNAWEMVYTALSYKIHNSQSTFKASDSPVIEIEIKK